MRCRCPQLERLPMVLVAHPHLGGESHQAAQVPRLLESQSVLGAPTAQGPAHPRELLLCLRDHQDLQQRAANMQMRHVDGTMLRMAQALPQTQQVELQAPEVPAGSLTMQQL